MSKLNNPNFNSIEFDGFKKQADRLNKLNQIPIEQMKLLTIDNSQLLKGKTK